MNKLTPHQVKDYYQLPEKVIFCKKCVVSNQRPRITFDKNGVCNACNYAYKKNNLIDWAEREKELLELLDKFRSKDGSYDVVVPVSGGKDSSSVAHKLKYKYNMHPLTVTWAPHIYTQVGWSNLQNFIHSGFDNILGTPNGKVHKSLTRLSFELLGDPFQPFVFGQMSFPFKIATKFNIPLVFYGENGEAEYGGSQDNENKNGQSLEDFNRFYFSKFTPDSFTKFNITETDLQAYTLPTYKEMKEAGVEMHWFGYYTKWIPQENYYYSVENCGFEANPNARSEGTHSRYASLDDKIDGFHYYLSYIKFGLGRATSDASQEIRSGHITRDEAIALVRRYDGQFPELWFKEFLKYTDISEDFFWKIINSFRSSHLWHKIDGDWKLITEIQ